MTENESNNESREILAKTDNLKRELQNIITEEGFGDPNNEFGHDINLDELIPEAIANSCNTDELPDEAVDVARLAYRIVIPRKDQESRINNNEVNDSDIRQLFADTMQQLANALGEIPQHDQPEILQLTYEGKFRATLSSLGFVLNGNSSEGFEVTDNTPQN